MNIVFRRLREPSTMAGLGGLALLVGANVEQVQAISQAAAAILAALAVFIPERGTTK